MFQNAHKDMRIKYEHNESKQAFQKFVVPALLKNNIPTSIIEATATRVGYGRDFRNFTLLFDDPNGWGYSEVDVTLNNYIKFGALDKKLYTASAFIKNRYLGPMSSCGFIYIPNLVYNLLNYGTRKENDRTGQTFLTLPFNHRSISSNTVVIYS